MAKTEVRPSTFEEMQLFQMSCDLLNSVEVTSSSEYSGRWVAALDGQIVGSALSREDLVQKLDADGVPLRHTHIKFIGPLPPLLFF
ncbi:MAG: hypothetical protein JSS65_01990 [Armatimonadetes bacterium]|nr:hypothetical protein [Armatimonadota bacterium]